MTRKRQMHAQHRREKKLRDLRRRISKADSLGRRVPPTVEAYEQICAKGDKKLGQTLIARHTRRMDCIRLSDEHMRVRILSTLVPITILDMSLLHLGASVRRPPAAYIGGWVDHIAWGVDSAVAVVRMLLCGQIVGAAALARNQLERWTLHRATSTGVRQRPGESTGEYIARVWSAHDEFDVDWFSGDRPPDALQETDGDVGEPEIDHKHIVISDGSEICPAVLYVFLSEIMHGRELLEASAWDSGGLLDQADWPDDLYVATGVITDTITLCLRELRVATTTLAARRGIDRAKEALIGSLDTFSKPDPELDSASNDGHAKSSRPTLPHLTTLIPLLPQEGLHPDVVQGIRQQADVYEAVLHGQRPAGRLFRDDELTTYAFAWHRARSVRTALKALHIEQRMLGDDFDADSLSHRASGWILVSEAMSLLGQWHPRTESAASCKLIGTALRSANWLWLEDDDRAMAVLRCVLEQTSRLRTWRLKPAKAQKLEGKPETTPRDWLEAAGWKRLLALNKALGELAHTKATSRWSGARELLAKFQMDVDDDRAIFTARGSCLTFVQKLAAQELCAEMKTISPTISEALARIFERGGWTMDSQAGSIEAQLDLIWAHRKADLGVSDFVAMPELWPSRNKFRTE